MRCIVTSISAGSACLALAACGGPTTEFEQVVQMPRAQLYAELEQKFARVEADAAANPITTGHPPYPIRFRFQKDRGKHLAIDWRAGFREENFEYWLEDGANPGETVLKANITLSTLREKVHESSLLGATEDMLDQADLEFNAGSKVHALVGGSSADD
jgi:hypothetical protein